MDNILLFYEANQINSNHHLILPYKDNCLSEIESPTFGFVNISKELNFFTSFLIYKFYPSNTLDICLPIALEFNKYNLSIITNRLIYDEYNKKQNSHYNSGPVPSLDIVDKITNLKASTFYYQYKINKYKYQLSKAIVNRRLILISPKIKKYNNSRLFYISSEPLYSFDVEDELMDDSIETNSIQELYLKLNDFKMMPNNKLNLLNIF